MSINIGPATSEDHRPRITVVGIGGAGGNAIANMIESEIEGVDFIVANTDAQALSMSKADAKIQLGPDIEHGFHRSRYGRRYRHRGSTGDRRGRPPQGCADSWRGD